MYRARVLPVESDLRDFDVSGNQRYVSFMEPMRQHEPKIVLATQHNPCAVSMESAAPLVRLYREILILRDLRLRPHLSTQRGFRNR